MTRVRLPWQRNETRATPQRHHDGPLTVVVVDDVEAIRVLVRTTLEPEFRVLAEATDGAEAVAACREHRPDIVLLDLNMPRHDGLEAIRAIRDVSPDTAIVVLSGLPADAIADKALALGADRFVDKTSPLHELRETLLAVAAV